MSYSNQEHSREFLFTEQDFERVRVLLYDKAGISLSDIKHDMVYNRLVKRLRVYQLRRIKDYLDLLEDTAFRKEELTHFINALTTNLTAFFREPHHFDFLSKLVPTLLAKQPRVRIWSSACSVGEEPYSIAMCLYPLLSAPSQLEIIATDIDTNVLATARSGVYELDRVSKLPNAVLKEHFLKGTGPNAGTVKVKQHLRDLIEFKPFNLINHWPQQQPFDIIFCRNVMIYFEKKTQQKLILKMAENMTNNGHLFIGHSETLNQIDSQLELVGQTIYRKAV